MKISKNNATPVRGDTPEAICRSIDTALRQIWKSLNEVIDAMNNIAVGTQDIESKRGGIRVTQDGNTSYLEAKLDSGWARLNADGVFEMLTKKKE